MKDEKTQRILSVISRDVYLELRHFMVGRDDTQSQVVEAAIARYMEQESAKGGPKK